MTRVLEAFAGLGGQALGWHRAGAEHVAFIEREPFPQRVLARHWPSVPIHDDILAFDPEPYRGRVDVLTGGCPCQPASSAGKRKGRSDDRWLWGAFIDLGIAVDAPIIVAENPTALLTLESGDAFASILHHLGDHGYRVEWDVLAAGTLGAPHRRSRVFIVARRDGVWSFDPAAIQRSMFPGRPKAWPKSGRWYGGTLSACSPLWPTPNPLPWEVAADAEPLPTPRTAADWASRGSMVENAQWSAPSLAQAVELKMGILPREFHNEDELTPQARRMFGEAKRRARPAPTAKDSADRDYQISGGKDAPTLGHAAKTACGVESQMARRALPTPKAADGRAKGNGGNRKSPCLDQMARRRALPTPVASDGEKDPSNSLSKLMQTGSRTGRGNAAAGMMLNPSLPEWMMGFEVGWSWPEGPSRVDAPSRPYLPDLTAELALTTEREHRRARLKAIGNACQVEVAETIARKVLR